MSSPADFGYAICSRCGTQRPEQRLAHSPEASAAYVKWLSTGGKEPWLGPVACVDMVWCRSARTVRCSWCNTDMPTHEVLRHVSDDGAECIDTQGCFERSTSKGFL